MKLKLLSEIHVGIRRLSFRERRERVAFPDETHAEPQGAETVFKFLAGANGPDKACHNQSPKASVYNVKKAGSRTS